MDEMLMERCNRQIKNERVLREAVAFGSEESIKLGALLYTAINEEADVEKIEACQMILREKTGLFSTFRGALQTVILLKMSRAEDPEAYIDNVLNTYNRLTRNVAFPGLLSVLAAVTIYEQHGDQDVDALVDQILDIYAEAKRIHPYLCDESDMAYIALMVLSGRADIAIEEEKEKIYILLKEKFHLPAEAAQSTALVLITASEKTAEEKVDSFIRFYEALKETGHATAKNRYISIYGIFTDLNIPTEETTAAISEVDQFLKEQKGYGIFSVSSDLRKVLASTLVLQHYTTDVPSWPVLGDSGVRIEALLFAVIMNMVVLI